MSCYEIAMFARKESARLQKFPIPDWIQFPPVLGDKRSHLTEKPLELGKWVVQHTGTKGGTMFDPFAGSFAFVHAALSEGMKVSGCDVLPEAVLVGKSRISKFLLEK